MPPLVSPFLFFIENLIPLNGLPHAMSTNASERCPFIVSQSVSQPISQSVSQSVSQSGSQSVSHSVSLPSFLPSFIHSFIH